MLTEQTEIAHTSHKILEQLGQVISGRDDTLLWMLVAVLAKGHILLEDMPGVGKTTLALAFSQVLGLSCRRMQFTPDVMPSDITGYTRYHPITGAMEYQPGPVLCNLFLADELNRANTRTQAALLEAMQEGQVTVDGISHRLPSPFSVIATQNPVGAAGTQPLPDSQLDRFSVRLTLGYPLPKDELAMLLTEKPVLSPLLEPGQLEDLQQLAAATYLGDAAGAYLIRLIRATRRHSQILRGASPRATVSLAAMARVLARLRGRDFVIPADIRDAYVPAIAHRIQPASQTAGADVEILTRIRNAIPLPEPY